MHAQFLTFLCHVSWHPGVFCIGFRYFVAKLNDEDLSEFMVNKLFGNGFYVCMISLFVISQNTHCLVVYSFEECSHISDSSQFLSVWMIGVWVVRMMIFVNVKTARGSEFAYSWNNFATPRSSDPQNRTPVAFPCFS